MEKFKFEKTNIDGLYVIEPTIFGDHRGYFMETYNEKEFHKAGITAKFVQDNESRSKKGVLRGLHFQKKHPQGKLVRVLEGEVLDVVVDLRDGSKTFGQWYGVVLSAEKHNQFYIPEGFAHGFYVLSDSATFCYKCTNFYDPTDEGGIIWNDPDIGIDWGIKDGDEVLLSDKDKAHPLLKNMDFRF